MEFNAKNFAIWMALKEIGKHQYTNGLFKSDNWSIYGGYRTDGTQKNLFAKKHSLNVDANDFMREAFYVCVHKIGIDYDKTSAPESVNKKVFNGTFADPDYDDYLIGELILKDGTVVTYAIESKISMNQFDNFVEFMEFVKEQNATS